jgi:hypothetical protein
MKKILYLLITISILLSSTLVSASVFNTASGSVYTGTSYLKVTLVNQTPLTADPGGYVELTFKIENKGTDKAENVTLELMPQYPFSLDPGISAVNELDTLKGAQNDGSIYFVTYKLRVDKDAINGDSEIKLKFFEGDGSVYNIGIFNLSVSNPRTDFDVVFQSSTSASSTTTGTSTLPSTTLTIVNIGSSAAQSVIVKIPQQVYFRAVEPSAAVIGNLNGGDYTLVNFQIVPTSSNNTSVVRDKNLTVEISYTDLLGIRRTVQKDVPLTLVDVVTTGRFTQRSQSQTLFSNSFLYIVIGAAGIIVIVIIIKVRTRKKK